VFTLRLIPRGFLFYIKTNYFMSEFNNETNFRIGDKVILKPNARSSAGRRYEETAVIENMRAQNQPFAYVTRVIKRDVTVSTIKGGLDSTFDADYLELYEPDGIKEGYIPPYDIASIGVDADTDIFVKTDDVYHVLRNGEILLDITLPAEIVESWEKETQLSHLLMLGDCIEYKGTVAKVVKINTDHRIMIDRKFDNMHTDFHPDSIVGKAIQRATKSEYDSQDEIIIATYKAEVADNKVAFGCQNFTKDELKAIYKLFNSEIRAKITIRGVDIQSGMIQSLINKLDKQ